MNRVILIGRLTDNPEIKTAKGDLLIAEFRLAVKRRGREEPDYIPITAFRQNAEFAQSYLTKGRLVSVEGSLQTNEWKDEEGKTHRGYEIVAESLSGLDKPKETAADAATKELVAG